MPKYLNAYVTKYPKSKQNEHCNAQSFAHTIKVIHEHRYLK